MESKETNAKSKISLREEEIQKFWADHKIFEKTLDVGGGFLGKYFGIGRKKEFTFYDGPPFATGLPHYGHILASAIKDAVPRYKTMRGFRVERRWGWDCHGLPIENIVEKDLGIAGRKNIEQYGIGKFNEYARSKVLTFVKDWKKTVDRMGRWVDFDGSYKTMDNSYIESVWYGVKSLYDKGLIYEGTRVLPYCPRCETPIANSEIAMDGSYKDITDISVYVKFPIKGEKNKPKWAFSEKVEFFYHTLKIIKTKNTYKEIDEKDKEECDTLVNFFSGLDFEKYIHDIEVTSIVNNDRSN